MVRTCPDDHLASPEIGISFWVNAVGDIPFVDGDTRHHVGGTAAFLIPIETKYQGRHTALTQKSGNLSVCRERIYKVHYND